MSGSPIPLRDVLIGEYTALRPGVNFGAQNEAELARKAHSQENPFSALCISGGGIRSATFALGALQALAEHGLLEQFDYLSTVSGGGYIGGWLTAWVQRAGGIGNVIPRLQRDAPAAAPDETDPIQHLREYNNYLTPKLGALSPDTWTLVATVVRNIFLNWLVLIPILLFALMIPRFLLSIDRFGDLYVELHRGGADAISSSLIVSWGLPLLAAALFVLSMINTLRYLPAVGGADHTAADFVRYILSPLVLAVLAFVAYDSLYFLEDKYLPTSLIQVSLWTLIPSFAAWLLYLMFCRKKLKKRLQLLAGPLSIAIALMGIGTGTAAWYLTNYLLVPTSWAVYVTIALPLLLMGFSGAGALFIGLSSTALEDEDREWLSRGAAYVMLVCFIWVAACAVVLLVPRWIFALYSWAQGAVVAAGGIAAWLSALVGHRGEETKSHSGGEARPSPLGWVAKVAPPVFLLLLATGLSMLTNAILSATGSLDKAWWDHDYLLEHTRWFENLEWAAVFFAISWVMARFININKFSLEGMYRDRLIRAYLGASNPHRKANKFIGFCKSDNIQMHDLNTALRPFHVVNLTLNLVGGDRLAWQQRKAEPVTATALHVGNSRLGYRESAGYGGKDGISLGSAIAISGAAASPSMGYHSSPVIGFIMTLFNLRLGAWLGNPGPSGDHTWTFGGPHSAIKSLVREAFGLTNDDSEYVYLSDGGHFENLGLYEMVRRRCRTIVVLDGSCDDTFTYEDLGNALRKIRIDMGIPIVFGEGAAPPAFGGNMKRCAVATIRYSEVDDAGADGRLIYIKPMIQGNEPPDVTSYHSANHSFPHQSTAEQWFDESQTESYRMLGQLSIDEVFSGWNPTSLLKDAVRHVEAGYLKIDAGGDPSAPKTIAPAK